MCSSLWNHHSLENSQNWRFRLQWCATKPNYQHFFWPTTLVWTSDTTLQQGQSQPHTDFHIRHEALESSKILDVSRIWKNQKVSGTVGTFAKGKCTTVANRTCNTCTSNRTDTTSFENPTQYYTHWRHKKQQQNVSTWFQHRFDIKGDAVEGWNPALPGMYEYPAVVCSCGIKCLSTDAVFQRAINSNIKKNLLLLLLLVSNAHLSRGGDWSKAIALFGCWERCWMQRRAVTKPGFQVNQDRLSNPKGQLTQETL